MFILKSELIRKNACQAIMAAPEGYSVIIRPVVRTIDQNAKQWPILQAFSEQLEWPVNGLIRELSAEEWKDILTAAFKQEKINIAQGLNGGIVMLGQRTRNFNKKEFSEWIEFLLCVAAEKGVVLNDE